MLKGDLKKAIEMHQMLYEVSKKHTFLPEVASSSPDNRDNNQLPSQDKVSTGPNCPIAFICTLCLKIVIKRDLWMWYFIWVTFCWCYIPVFIIDWSEFVFPRHLPQILRFTGDSILSDLSLWKAHTSFMRCDNFIWSLTKEICDFVLNW